MDTAPEGMRLGKGQVRGKGRCAGAMEGVGVFFVRFVSPLLARYFFWVGKGMGDIRGRKWICVAIDRSMGGRASKASLCLYLYSYVYR